MRAALLLAALALAACAHPPAPPAPALSPPPSPSPAPASPTPGAALFLIQFGHPSPDVDYFFAVSEAAAEWERALGRPLFSWRAGRRSLILVQFPAIEGGDRGEDVAIGGVTFREQGVIAFSGQAPEATRRTVALHEMGHALGIVAHSADPQSVMYRRSTAQTLTPADAAAAIAALDKETP